MASSQAPTVQVDLEGRLERVATGKVRDLYAIDDQTLLFVASDRISAYDVILSNGIPQKGALLTLLSAHWFRFLSSAIPSLRTHFKTLELPASLRQSPELVKRLQHRSMQVRRFPPNHIFPIEAIVRGYITGSGWKEYSEKGTVHGIEMPEGLRESERLQQAVYTPSTKAELGGKDENIHPDQARQILQERYGKDRGARYAQRVEELALEIYSRARDYAVERGIIIADTKFEFGLDAEADEVVLVDEVLTPDSSRFWPAATYEVGRSQDSFDKQYLRDWLTSNGLKGKQGVEMPPEVLEKTAAKYREAFEMLVGRKWDEALASSAQC
ncbi:hypothetical protein BJ546DRAFT_851654 [Cryomyces antarcticus]|nr:Bifunctional purine biosynthetic protein ade1 [Cryomyces antarcticus]KAK5019157.1 Bifunctional purine biosynthetic protein ade1 [Cryomyces antarcticus]